MQCQPRNHSTATTVHVCRGLRLAAILELQEIFDQGLYSSADKKLQQMIYEDLTVAAQQHDR